MSTGEAGEGAGIPHQETQRWVSELKEMRYKNLVKDLSSLKEQEGQEGIRHWFLQQTNKHIIKAGREPLREEDVKTINLFVVESDSASAITGREIKRPVFVFGDNTELRHFHRQFTGIDFQGSVHASVVIEDIDAGWGEKTGLIIAEPLGIAHEVAHSIDPHERIGQDIIIDELFAYMTDAVYHNDITNINSDQLRNHLRGALVQDEYYELLRRQPGFMLTREQFNALCHATIDVAIMLREDKGDLEALRSIVQAKKLDNLFALVKSKPPSF